MMNYGAIAPVELKRAPEGADTSVITGYGAVFGNVDRGGDRIVKGAFKTSLQVPRPIKMLWQHDPSKPVGVWTKLEEDDHGLKVEGSLFLETQQGSEAHTLLKGGAIDGLSIGYQAIDTDPDPDDDAVRVLKSVRLWEISLVTFPMNEQAVVGAVKAADLTDREIERRLTQDAGFSRKEARALMRAGLDAMRGTQDAAPQSDGAAATQAAQLQGFLKGLGHG